MHHESTTDTADVIVFPPVIPLAGLVLSLVARKLRPMPLAPDRLAGPRKVAGLALIAAGMGIASWAMMTFQRAGTSVDVHEPSTALVEDGPFRYTRNPIYVSMGAVFSGVSLLLNNLWGVVLLPVVMTLLQHGVIEREEAYLRARFGDAYDAYTQRVPRWLR